MERLDELHRSTLVDQPWRPLRGAVIAERRMIAATLVDNIPVANRRTPRTPPAPPPRPPSSTTHAQPRTATPRPAPASSDPLEQLAAGCY
jgi:hypothetical protein